MVNKVFEKRIGRNIDPHDRVLLVDLEDNATILVWKCEKRQFNNKISRVPIYKMISISGAWPFDLWASTCSVFFP
jgi:selenocysteine lyase/cysteine desulfurase